MLDRLQFGQDARRLRLDTLSRLRWLALLGQLATVLATEFIFRFSLPLTICFSVIGISAFLNFILQLRAPKNLRLTDTQATLLLAFDVLQLASLLYFTGGLENPFAMLFLAPITIASVSLPLPQILSIGLLAALSASVLGVEHWPLPWYSGQSVSLPLLYRFGLWTAILVASAFIGAYASRVAREARALSQALTATELALERENHLSQLDGLAAAAAHELGTPLATIALVTRELSNANFPPEISEDLTLLTQEVKRCRAILGRLTSLATEEQQPFGRSKLGVLLEQIAEPYRQAPVEIRIDARGEEAEPLLAQNPAIIYGLGNFIENAIDFAKTSTIVEARWTEDVVQIVVLDDGPGFSVEVANRIGEPYVTSRANRRMKGDKNSGLGLGVFIAKTLLERTGAQIKFSNRETGGAKIQVAWERRRLEGLDA